MVTAFLVQYVDLITNVDNDNVDWTALNSQSYILNSIKRSNENTSLLFKMLAMLKHRAHGSIPLLAPTLSVYTICLSLGVVPSFPTAL